MKLKKLKEVVDKLIQEEPEAEVRIIDDYYRDGDSYSAGHEIMYYNGEIHRDTFEELKKDFIKMYTGEHAPMLMEQEDIEKHLKSVKKTLFLYIG